MVRVTRVCVLAMMLLACRGQPEGVLSAIADTTRQLTGAVVSQPLIQVVAQGAGEILARTVYDVTRLPVAVVRALGGNGNIPVLINENNIADQADKIIGEFKAGLGNEDAVLNFEELITKYGYKVEKHETVTEDGYGLTMFRIPGNGSVVFLMHGLLGSADDFVITGKESSLGYLLADEGYDVWFGNARGNKHSRRHNELDPSESKFWDFSWHEIGYFDLPAMIDYVLNTTNKKTLKYIGHSQGTTSFFVMGSERPDYNDKIALMIALSPGAYYTHAVSPFIRLTAPASGFLGMIAQGIGLHEVLPDGPLIRILKTILCGTGPIAEIMCYNQLLVGCGFGFAEMNVTNLPVINGHTPSGASLKQVLHYGQLFNSADFRQYDHGTTKNLRVYGNEVPPSYVLENISAPVSLFYSDHDWFSHPTDVDALYQRLSNAVDIHKIPHPQFNHLDYIWAKNVKTLIFDRVRKLLDAFDKPQN
ncbi:lipase 3-like [Plodia interpunctella]|uniref:lipase 3-like n=1 Tax=Plodia interpunctella TaxID=58824 RepID=UPI002367D3DE|nr:lipase 3-like [Plodia interpunctella]